MHLTPARVAAAYDFLRILAPFARLKLPEADLVEFNLVRDRANYATYTHYCRTNEHIISLCADTPWTLDFLLMMLAHEMIHLYQRQAKLTTKAVHNADFRRRARVVCRAFGWNYHVFMREE